MSSNKNITWSQSNFNHLTPMFLCFFRVSGVWVYKFFLRDSSFRGVNNQHENIQKLEEKKCLASIFDSFEKTSKRKLDNCKFLAEAITYTRTWLGTIFLSSFWGNSKFKAKRLHGQILSTVSWFCLGNVSCEDWSEVFRIHNFCPSCYPFQVMTTKLSWSI